MKKELLMTTLKGPAIPLAKGIDGRRFVGAHLSGLTTPPIYTANLLKNPKKSSLASPPI